MEDEPTRSELGSRSLGAGVFSKIGRHVYVWCWPVLLFAALLILSWLIQVESGHWSQRLKSRIANEAGGLSFFSDIQIDGREVELRGTVPNDDVKAQLAEAARRTPGVRSVKDLLEVSVPAASPPVAVKKERFFATPSIVVYRGADRRPLIRGRWPHASQGTLQVKLGGRTYTQGESAALKVAGGHFALTPDNDLEDGSYDVEVSVKAENGIISDKTRNEIFIDGTAPKPPTVGIYVGMNQTPAIRGTWDNDDAQILEVTFADKNYQLGISPLLVGDDQGNWTLVPQQLIEPGIYDVKVVTKDSFGNASSDVSENELVIGNVASAAAPATQLPGGLRPVASGKWGEGRGQILEVVLNGKTYRLGVDTELTSDGQGNWSLAPGLGINDGIYNLTVRSIGDNGSGEVFATTRKIAIDNNSPNPPRVEPYAGYGSPVQISGTWDNKEAVKLEVTIGEKKIVLGKDVSLTSDEDGHWIFKLDVPLDNGTHEVAVKTTDSSGNVSEDQTVAEIVVKSLEAARMQPFFAALENDGIVLRGAVPVNVDMKKLGDHAGQKLKNSRIIDRSEKIKTDVPDGWLKAAFLGIDQLARLNSGSVQVFENELSVSGDAKNEASAAKIEQDVMARLPNGFGSAFTLTVNAGLGIEECQARFDGVLEEQPIDFKEGTAEFSKSSFGALDQLSKIARLCKKRVIEISGHTDSAGAVDVNLALSRKRAEAVAEFLAKKVPGELSLATAGFGETRPVGSNKTLAGRQKNRRIEFLILP